MAGVLGRPPFSPGRGPAHGIPQFATDEEQRTTLVMGNVPCGVTRDELINVMNENGFEGAFNFVYLPIDFKTTQSKGYGFVNLMSTELAHRFIDAFNGFTQWPIRCWKTCTVTWAKTQGLKANVDRLRNAVMMGDDFPDTVKPALFVGKNRVPFPEPTYIKDGRPWYER
jgi:RNA recognition motif-containing protein